MATQWMGLPEAGHIDLLRPLWCLVERQNKRLDKRSFEFRSLTQKTQKAVVEPGELVKEITRENAL